MDQDLSTNPFADDRLHEECGIFGIWGKPDAAAFVVLGLHALQHRGQEAAGVVATDGEQFFLERQEGLVGDKFSVGGPVPKLKGRNAIGHVRYSTTGGTMNRNIQPFFADVANGGIAIAHNGNLTNAVALRKQLVQKGSIFYSTSDTECIVHLVATSKYEKIVDRLVDALKQIEGAYSLVCLTRKKLIGVRDPLGVRPLVIGKLEDAYVLASETCALDIIGADYVRDVKPGEVVVISDEGEKIETYQPFPPQRQRFCIFEHIYFARPDSIIDGLGVYDVRKSIGPSKPTWSYRCPTPASPAQSATRKPRRYRSNLASSAITMSAARSSNRPTISATSASA
jgi:amidophosphoribosyltransferase